MNALEVLKKYWKHTTFRDPQEAIIHEILQQKNVVALLPTGSGKSICYQIPALLMDGVCLVISPLIALMRDQVESLQEKGIKALAITSALSQNETVIAFDNLQYGNYKFLYLSPEKLQSEFIQQKLAQLNLSLIAVDEAHCISEWGHDFRPAYSKIALLKAIFPKVPFVAVTATATERVFNDIIESLQLGYAQVFKTSLGRENIAMNVVYGEDLHYQLLHILDKLNSPSIVYINSRRKVREVCHFLINKGFKAVFYHGGLSTAEKHLAYESWMEEKSPIMVATTAFGMGIDKNNVHTIIHYNLPFSLENYMQESGRAGRDGKPAFSYIFTNPSNIRELREQVLRSSFTLAMVKDVYKKLNQYFHVSYGELSDENYALNLNQFCEQYEFKVLPTYSILKFLEKEQVIFLDEDLNRKSTVHFIENPDKVLDYSQRTNAEILQTLLRSYGGVFEQPIAINEEVLAKKMNLAKPDIKKALDMYAQDEILIYTYNKNTSLLKFLVPREDDKTINPFSKDIIQLSTIKNEKLEAVINFVTNKNVCRTKKLLSYFNEDLEGDCGKCDVCQRKSYQDHASLPELAKEILTILNTSTQLSVRELVEAMDKNQDAVLTSLQLLLDTGKIKLNSQQKIERIYGQ